ncbi:uncharacterized protein MYCGRDRAFT_97741 [Zymoseptoria tritici IPO323]|uniref:Uncharacterized protein n=1 Tax=Zymoseptoria tritici (strain CBS 115943 / IPO323) TaxID=336722 RepID=F9XR82_ZYMTI|nr:uncharacterized protein MYCGRDRAFT_97741 [Zymoseptoria tritici IPO323]EGP82212.1 hypothetical protein MYCGRDRAFT_97741 [Zymoseptoria tritici IPO323]
MPLCPRFYREMQTSRLQVEEQFGFSAMPFLGRTAVTIQGQSPAVDVDDQHKLIMTHCAASPTATAKALPLVQLFSWADFFSHIDPSCDTNLHPLLSWLEQEWPAFDARNYAENDDCDDNVELELWQRGDEEDEEEDDNEALNGDADLEEDNADVDAEGDAPPVMEKTKAAAKRNAAAQASEDRGGGHDKELIAMEATKEPPTRTVHEFAASGAQPLSTPLRYLTTTTSIGLPGGPAREAARMISVLDALKDTPDIFGVTHMGSEATFSAPEARHAKMAIYKRPSEHTTLDSRPSCRCKAAASGKAKEEAATDAMKWPLRNFGKVVGDCPYDKDYLSRTTKAKCNPQSEVVSIHPFSYRCSAQQLLKLMIAQEVGPILAACGLQVIVLYSRHHLRNRPQ